MIRFFLFIFIFISLQNAYTQSFNALPVVFDPFQNNYTLIHPAATGMESSFKLFLGYKTQSGAFTSVNTNFVGVAIRSKKKDSLDIQFHGFGANVVNDREGAYFARNRIYVSYAWHNRIAQHWYLSGGAMVGCINYNYKGTDIYPGGTSLKPTADIGLMVYKKNDAHLGVTISQVIPGNLSPLESQLKILPFVSASADKKFRLDYKTNLQCGIYYRQVFTDSKYILAINGMANFFKIITLGTTVKIDNGFSLIGGLHLPFDNIYGIHVYFSYYTPFFINGNLIDPTFEFNCVLIKF